jgi:hypothetical protein
MSLKSIFVIKKDRFELLIDPQFNDLNKFGCRDDRFVVFCGLLLIMLSSLL